MLYDIPYPCAHCGGRSILYTYRKKGAVHFAVKCLTCGVKTRFYAKREHAVAVWNRRAGDCLPDGLRSVITHNKGG